MVMGKLGALLNTDLGALVKDAGKATGDIAKSAGKMLNADVGDIAKGAGKVLNADMGDLAKGAGRVFTMDLGELLRGVNDGAKPDEVIEIEAHTAAPVPLAAPTTAARVSATAAPAQSTPAVLPVVAPTGPKVSRRKSGETVKFTQDLVLRHKRTMPAGTDLKVLLPWSVADFERSHSTPIGELASDPVAAIYSSEGDRVQVQLTMCWDADEALQLVSDLKLKMGDKARTTADPSWVIGMTEQGTALIWTRDCYCFTATSAKGSAALADFLGEFPY